MRKLGQRAIVCREIFFTDAFVLEEHRLGAEGQVFHGVMRRFDIPRTVLGGAATGVARSAYGDAADHQGTGSSSAKRPPHPRPTVVPVPVPVLPEEPLR
jgi:alkylation response protein AidB-like acyl-CoA dehydrogenase